MTKTNDFPSVLKKSILWALLGAALSSLLSLAAAFIALKTKDPLSAAPIAATACVALGALVAAACAARHAGAPLAGIMCGVLFTAFFVLLSLCAGGDNASPWLYLAAVGGSGAGTLLCGAHKPNTAKRVKKLMKK